MHPLVWRLVTEGNVSLRDLDTHYSLSDVVVHNMMLDTQAYANWLQSQKGKSGG